MCKQSISKQSHAGCWVLLNEKVIHPIAQEWFYCKQSICSSNSTVVIWLQAGYQPCCSSSSKRHVQALQAEHQPCWWWASASLASHHSDPSPNLHINIIAIFIRCRCHCHLFGDVYKSSLIIINSTVRCSTLHPTKQEITITSQSTHL